MQIGSYRIVLGDSMGNIVSNIVTCGARWVPEIVGETLCKRPAITTVLHR